MTTSIETPHIAHSPIVGDLRAGFECVAPITGKQTGRGWQESRWHASVISSDIPAELRSEGSA